MSEIVRTGSPVNLRDAPLNPLFSYRPETGEDPFHAFLGVPLLRGGRPIGALVVQNRTSRTYAEDEVDDLQTIAMVLAEMVASGELVGLTELKDVELAPHRPERLKGQRFSDGLARGVAVLHEAPVAAGRLLAEDAAEEEERLHKALDALKRQIDQMLDGRHGLVGQTYDVLETYRMFANDRGWNRGLEEAVRSGLTAEAAVERVRSEHRARLGQARDAYLRERLHDLEDLGDRLLRHLAGDVESARVLPEDAILIARNLGPADLLEYDRTRLKGLLLEEGSSASHAALDRPRAWHSVRGPACSGLRDRVSEGDVVLVDGEQADAWLRPRPDVVEAFEARAAVRAQRRADLATLRDVAAVTKRRREDRAADERRPGDRPRHPARDRGGGRGPVPHRIPVHGRRADAPADRPDRPLRQGVWTRRATSPSPSARSISAATRSCRTWRASGRTIRRSAGARCAWGWTVPPCCASSCAP